MHSSVIVSKDTHIEFQYEIKESIIYSIIKNKIKYNIMIAIKFEIREIENS